VQLHFLRRQAVARWRTGLHSVSCVGDLTQGFSGFENILSKAQQQSTDIVAALSKNRGKHYGLAGPWHFVLGRQIIRILFINVVPYFVLMFSNSSILWIILFAFVSNCGVWLLGIGFQFGEGVFFLFHNSFSCHFYSHNIWGTLWKPVFRTDQDLFLSRKQIQGDQPPAGPAPKKCDVVKNGLVVI